MCLICQNCGELNEDPANLICETCQDEGREEREELEFALEYDCF